jgi:hypothetical protein
LKLYSGGAIRPHPDKVCCFPLMELVQLCGKKFYR